jgi:hypothetical protein
VVEMILFLFFPIRTLTPVVTLLVTILGLIIIPIIIGKKINNVALKCTLLIFFNWIFAVYYFIKAIREKE